MAILDLARIARHSETPDVKISGPRTKQQGVGVCFDELFQQKQNKQYRRVPKLIATAIATASYRICAE